MKISEMTDTLFDREMQRLLGDVQFWCVRLGNIGDYTLTPALVSYMDGSGQQPFPLALEAKRVWDYAKGAAPRPAEMREIIQDLCELLWSHIGGSGYEIPSEFWDEPLGFACHLASARADMEAGSDLTTDQVAALSGLTTARIKQLCAAGELPAAKADDNPKAEWIIQAGPVREWLEKRG